MRTRKALVENLIKLPTTLEEETMRGKLTQAAVVGALFIVAPLVASAAEDIGKLEYDNNCAVCHGTAGKGDGPYAGIIETRIPDITTLTKSNNGVFPYDRVYQTIDGRADVKAHGSRDMPIWGNEYNAKAAEYYSDYLHHYNAEGFVRGRILALINYIYTLQEK
jgi:mono/diheme cytochrome c family protein